MSYHGAPERYGIYSFLFPYIELFLLTGKTGKLKEFDEAITKRETLLVPYKKCSVEGYMDTHIKPSPKYMSSVKEVRGSWLRMDANDFIVIFKKEYANMIGEYNKYSTHNWNGDRVSELTYTCKSPYKLFSKDHLEIFIPRGTKIKAF